MKFRLILIFTLMLSGLYIWLLEPNRIYAVSIEQNKETTALLVAQTQKKQPVIAYNEKEKCWILDFSNSMLAEAMDRKTWVGKFIKMAYMSTLSYKPSTTRLRLFLEPHSSFKVAIEQDKVEIIIASKKLASKKYFSQKLHLQNPSDTHLSPVLIDLKNQPLAPLINKLAENIGVKLLLKNNLPEMVSLKLEASSSSEALIGISELLGIEITKHGQIWALKKISDDNNEK